MAKIKGICRNEECDHCDEIMEAEKSNFVCEYCQKPLFPLAANSAGGGGRFNTKLNVIILAAILILGGLGYGGYATFDSHQKKVNMQRIKEDSIKAKVKEDSIKAAQAQEKARSEVVAKVQAKADSIIAANEKLLEEKGKKIREDAKKAIDTQLTSLRTVCQTLQFENIALIDTIEVAINECWKNADQLTPTSNTGRNPSWGRYEGPRQNGLPNGSGILYINRTTTINGQTARPGERIEGVFRNGYVNMGTWFKNDGNTVVVKDFKVL